MSRPNKVSVSGGEGLGHNPFGALSGISLPSVPQKGESKAAAAAAKDTRNRGRVDVLREKAGRGGKTVTIVTGFVGIGLPEKEALAKQMQRTCGTGGTVKEGRIEIQGDKRDQVMQVLAAAGFRPVAAGG